MTAQLINGKQTAIDIEEKLKQTIAGFSSAPQLAIILVGNDEPSLIYVRNKQKAADNIGVNTKLYHLTENTSEKDLIKLIQILYIFF